MNRITSIFNRRKAAHIEHLATEAETPTKETQYARIVRLLDKRGTISPQDCLRHPRVTTKLSTRIGEMERKTGIAFVRGRDPETRFRTYACANSADLETLKSYYLKDYIPF